MTVGCEIRGLVGSFDSLSPIADNQTLQVIVVEENLLFQEGFIPEILSDHFGCDRCARSLGSDYEDLIVLLEVVKHLVYFLTVPLPELFSE